VNKNSHTLCLFYVSFILLTKVTTKTKQIKKSTL